MSYHRIYADLGELVKDAPVMVLDADVASGASSLTVKSILGAAANDIVLLREPGNELAEIGSISGAPSGNTVALLAAVAESHPAGTTVYIIKANKVQFFWSAAEADANTDDSTLTALAAAQNIDPTTIRNFYDDTVKTTGYYYYQFSNSVASVDLRYSDAIPWGTGEAKFARDHVGYILESVRRKLSCEWDDRFSKETAMDEINACFNYIQGKLKRWSRYLKKDYVLGQTARGTFKFTLPDDIYDDQSNKSILQLRINGQDDPLKYLDEKEWDQVIAGVKHTPVRTQAVATDVTLEVDNSYDFDDDGTLHIYTGGTLDEITYTAITRSATAGVFTGVPATGDGAIGATHAVDTEVWQGESEGEPMYFTVKNGEIFIYPLCDETWENKNVLMDYNTEATAVDSESDTVDAPRYDMVREWLLWKGKSYWRNNGKDDIKDDSFLLFNDMLRSAIRTDISGQKYKMRPKINQISYRSQHRKGFIYE
jgi:hypothetical protein